MKLYKLTLIFSMLIVFQSVDAQKNVFIKPGENLIIKNIPELAATIADEVKQYTESRSAGPVDWHPKKREMLMTTRFGNTNQLHYITMPGGARKQLTFFDEPVGNAVFDTNPPLASIARFIVGLLIVMLFVVRFLALFMWHDK